MSKMPVIYRCDHCRAETNARSSESNHYHDHKWNNTDYLLCDTCHNILNNYVIEFFQCGGKS